MKKHLEASLMGTLFHMCKSGRSFLNPMRVIPLRSNMMDVKRAVPIWRIMVNPRNIKMGDISSMFCNTIYRVFNMRYFDVQQIVLKHTVEERDIDVSLHDDDDDISLEGEGRDCEPQGMQERWLQENVAIGVASSKAFDSRL